MIPNDTMPSRHAERFAQAVARGVTTTHRPAHLRAARHSDGRVSLPRIVQYRLQDGTVLDLPPTVLSHPDPAPTDGTGPFRRPRKGMACSVPYTQIVHDFDAYDSLLRGGEIGTDGSLR
jgi:hypothetical protein